MAHFAELDSDNIVLRVVAVKNEILLNDNHVETEALGVQFCQSLFGGTWVQTSYNGSIRKNFAGIGDTYDSSRDAFVPPQPYASWTLREMTCQWEPPTAKPDDGNDYTWDEATTSWVQVQGVDP